MSSVTAGAMHGSVDSWVSIGKVVAICVLGALYGRGVQELWLRRGRGEVVPVRRALSFATGLAVLTAALLVPLHRIAHSPFTGHMIQHILIVVVAAPLLGAGGAALPMSLALPRRLRRQLNRVRYSDVMRWLRRPAHRALSGGLLFTGVLWIWHLPAVYMYAFGNPVVYAVQHVSFVVVSWLVWSAVLTPDRHRLSGPLAFLLLFGVGMPGAALGAVLTLAPAPLYPEPALAPGAGALADQQLAGLIMWIPMDVVALGLAMGVFGRWLAGLDRDHPAGRGVVQPDRLERATP